MRVLVVYESWFGNTRQVVEAVAEGARTAGDRVEVQLVDAGDAPPEPQEVDLLLVAAPTHAFGLSRSSTREDAVRQGATGPARRGVREWLAGLPRTQAAFAATLDTRVRRPRVPGSAARAAMRRLRAAGYRQLTAPTTFWVDGTPGPLAAGELDSARAWGSGLARELLTRTAEAGGR